MKLASSSYIYSCGIYAFEVLAAGVEAPRYRQRNLLVKNIGFKFAVA